MKCVNFLQRNFAQFKQITSACVVVGNEILSGSTRDTNSHFLSQFLTRNGWKLCEVQVIPDEISTISQRVSDLSETFDYVFTSGGLGSTHDDVTYEAICQAFPDVSLEFHQTTYDRMIEVVPNEKYINEAMKRMAILPTPNETYYTGDFFCPLLQVKNIFVLPGIPYIFEKLLLAHERNLFYSEEGIMSEVLVYTHLGESRFAVELEKYVLETIGDDSENIYGIEVGSYPRSKLGVNDQYRVKISIRGLQNGFDTLEMMADHIAEICDGWR